jgi:hypothetical protein
VCAATGPCSTLSVACQESPDCQEFTQCIGDGRDPATVDGCRTAHADGVLTFCADTQCTIYEQCVTVCDPSAVCPAGG